MDPKVTIRGETPADLPAIADVHLRAFGEGGSGVSLIPAMHRQRPGYDARLSLVAERAGEVVGHVLYSPRRHRLSGETVLGVNLSPLGVLPSHQGTGIGGALVEAGDAIVRALGYAFVTILGHETYYPRLGYAPHAYGESRLSIPAGALPSAAPLKTRAVLPDDAAALRALWLVEEGAVDMAMVPDETAACWFSPDPRVRCTVYLDGGEIVGYTRIASQEPGKARQFLAADVGTARRMAAQVACGGELTLPLHPASGSMPAFAGLATPEAGARPYCLGRSFAPSPYDDYFAEVRRGARPAGRIVWPAEFDV